MNLRQIEFFVHVAESGSFSRASAMVGLTQPAVSRQISALEAELRLRLLHRNGRGVSLTGAGERFLVYARGILHQLEGVRQAVIGSEADPAGKVAIGLPPSLGQVLTVPLVKAFRARYRRGELAIPTVDFCESGADRLRLFYRLVLHGGKRWKSGCSGALE